MIIIKEYIQLQVFVQITKKKKVLIKHRQTINKMNKKKMKKLF